MNTIAVDAMGGDFSPEEVVKGAIQAKNQGVNVVLSGTHSHQRVLKSSMTS